MSEPLLSVAIITYNQEEFISQTLDSILNQQHNFSFEIVIGDDCSKDNTRKILQEYKDKYPEIIHLLFNEQNLGIIKNYFNVLNNCKGKFIMECAGDDYWLPGKIASQLSFMKKNSECILSYSNAITKNESTGIEKKWNPIEKITFEDLLKANSIPALSVCFTKSALDKYLKEINPLEKKWLMEDYPMWLYFSKNGNCKYIDETLCVYRDLNDSESHSYCNIEKRKRFTESTIDVQKYFSEKYNIFTDESYYHMLRANVYKDFLIHSDKYDKTIAKNYIELYKTYEKSKLKIFVKNLIYSNCFLFMIYRNRKHD